MAAPSRQYPLWRGDCPRCGTLHTTFDVLAQAYRGKIDYLHRYECMVLCRACKRPSLMDLEWQVSGSEPEFLEWVGKFINPAFRSIGVVTVITNATRCPDHVPPAIKSIFDEASACLAISAFDASGTMFRKVVDTATRDLLPPQPVPEDRSDPNWIAWKVRKDLKLRLEWLIQNGKLTHSLSPLLESVREDGNDAAHAMIGQEEASDLQDFTEVFLETTFTVPGQIEANRVRRIERRTGQATTPSADQ